MQYRYNDFNISGFEPTHDAFIFLIRKKHPELVHGRDFWVGHEVARGSDQRISVAFIAEWSSGETPPTLAEMEQLALTHKTEWEGILNPVPTSAEKIKLALIGTEDPGQVARVIEDLIIAIDVRNPVPSKLRQWANDRVTKRDQAR